MSNDRVYSAPGDHIESKRPVVVSRYRGFTRANHWLTAVCMIVLLLSGFAFFHPSLYGLTNLFGGGQTTRWLHPIVGVLLTASFLGLFVQMWRLNLPRQEDAEWSRKIKDVLKANEEALPEVGKYNAGQKVMFWAMAWAAGVATASARSRSSEAICWAMVSAVACSPLAFCSSKSTSTPASAKACLKPSVAESSAGCWTSWLMPIV